MAPKPMTMPSSHPVRRLPRGFYLAIDKVRPTLKRVTLPRRFVGCFMLRDVAPRA
jgi:hypothetical protein